jgi:hypothetical protein
MAEHQNNILSIRITRRMQWVPVKIANKISRNILTAKTLIAKSKKLLLIFNYIYKVIIIKVL